MALFTFGMVTLVMSSNLLMIFICWEVMGICSYLLISHQADRKAACHAATKAFLVNAVADVGLLFGVILTFATFETLDVRQILSQAASVSGQTINLLALDRPRMARAYGHVDRSVSVYGLFGKVGPSSLPRLAAKCDGGPHPRLGADSRRHHGKCRPLFVGSIQRPGQAVAGRDDGDRDHRWHRRRSLPRSFL